MRSSAQLGIAGLAVGAGGLEVEALIVKARSVVHPLVSTAGTFSQPDVHYLAIFPAGDELTWPTSCRLRNFFSMNPLNPFEALKIPGIRRDPRDHIHGP